jgi:hypothetical protein
MSIVGRVLDIALLPLQWPQHDNDQRPDFLRSARHWFRETQFGSESHQKLEWFS